jgi:amidase
MPTTFEQQVTFLNTSDLAATAEFYGSTLGLPLVHEQPGFVLFYQTSPDAFLGICLRASREPSDVAGAIPTLVVPDSAAVDAWQITLEAKGVVLEKRAGPGVSSDGKHIPTIYNLFIRDNAGYLIEIQAFLDPAWPAPEHEAHHVADDLYEALISMTATEAIAQLRLGTVTPSELIDAFIAQYAKTEVAVNAVPIICIERARAAAAQLAETGHPSPTPPGYLYGLPVVIKDLSAVEGVRFTSGSPIYRDNIAAASDPIVLELESKGAIIVGKSNTPEFGAGSNTFNPVFGATVTPWDVRRSAGGSSGGAAAALASGTAWLATGSDLGGSLRIPAAFCGIYGFRVSPGRVCKPLGASGPLVSLHSISGPMARTAADLALFLDSMVDLSVEQQVGWDFAAPFNFPAGVACYTDVVAPSVYPALLPKRVAWSGDLNGLIAGLVEPQTLAMCEAAAAWFGSGARGGASLTTACPDLSKSRMIFNLLRGQSFAAGRADDMANSRELLKPEVVWNIGLGLAANDAPEAVVAAESAHQQLFDDVVAFFGEYDMLITPTVLVTPYDINMRYPNRIPGAEFGNYIDWMVLSWALTVTSCPIISMPIGFTTEGLPVGLQIVAKPFAEPVLLAAAAAYEAAHPEVAGATPTTPVRPDNAFEATVDGPRTVKEAQEHAESPAGQGIYPGTQGGAFEALFDPLDATGALFKSSL